MRAVNLFLAILIWAGCLSGGMAQTAAPQPATDIVLRSMPDGPVAMVNNASIPPDQFKSAYQSELLGLMAQMPPDSLNDVARVQTGIHALKMLIQRELLYQEATKRKVTISEAEVTKQWTSEIEKMKQGFRGTKGASLTESDILKAVGTTRESAMAQLRRGLIIDAVVDQLVKEKSIAVSDAEVNKFFEENKDKMKHPDMLHIKQIFIEKGTAKNAPVDEQKRAAARDAAQKALQRVRAGESFETVAKAVSQAPTKDKGGDLGALPTAALPKPIVEAANKMKPGDTSDVIEGDEGFSVIKLVETIAGTEASLDKKREDIQQFLLAQKKSKLVEEFCAKSFNTPGCIQVFLQLDKLTATNPDFQKLWKNLEAQSSKSPESKSPSKGPASTKKESTPKASTPAKATKKSTSKTEKH